MKIILLFSLIVLISGCSTMSIEECKIAQWENIGQKDASEGYDRLRKEGFYSPFRVLKQSIKMILGNRYLQQQQIPNEKFAYYINLLNQPTTQSVFITQKVNTSRDWCCKLNKS